MTPSKLAFIACALLIAPIAANATAVVYTFKGSVTSATGIYSSLGAGTPVTGSFTVNYADATSVTGTFSSSNWTEESNGGTAAGLAVPTGYVFSSTAVAGVFRYATAALSPGLYRSVSTVNGMDSEIWSASETTNTDANDWTGSTFKVAGGTAYYATNGLPIADPTAHDFSGSFNTTINGNVSTVSYVVLSFAPGTPDPNPGEAARGAQSDYLGQGRAGYTVWRPSTGVWFSVDTSGSVTGPDLLSTQFGLPTDIPVLGDFDGDGTSDFAVFRPSTGVWFIRRSSDQLVEDKTWGASTDVPIAGDFDGDGKTDLAVYRPSTGYWYIVRSSDGAVVATQFGASTDVPVVGDFDGDGKSDFAVYRPSTGFWYIMQSSTNTVVAKQWGASTDLPATGDYDGDGKTDIAVYRPSTGYWYIVQSSDGQVVAKQWGQSGDVPVPRDYDGDYKTDLAVWRPSTGYWYVIESSTGQTMAEQWGASTDTPVNSLGN